MTFTDNARRINALAVSCMSEAQSYLFDNPRHIGMGEIELKAAEADLEHALRMIRNLRCALAADRATITREAAE
jgi:hypothetical protein